MTQPQVIEPIAVDALVPRTAAFRADGYRFVQIAATRLHDKVELTYSFDKAGALVSLRLDLPPAGARVPSVSGVYGCAALYENEVHDLFNVQVDGMAFDFHGHLYTTAVKYPFGSTVAPKAPPKSAPKPAPASPAPAPAPAAPACQPPM
jgi:ech hydrogenase subunit D